MTEILLAVIAGIFGIWKTVDWVWKFRLRSAEKERAAVVKAKARSAEQKLKDAMGAITSLLDTLARTLTTTGAKHVVLCQAHNSGGPIKPGVTLFMSALHEVWRDEPGELPATLKKQRLDNWYLQMLCRVAENSETDFLAEDIPKYAFLKNTYARLDVERSRVFFVHMSEDTKKLHYLVVASDTVFDWPPDIMDHVRAAVNDIASILRQYEVS